MQIEPRRVQLMLDLTGSTYRRRFVKLWRRTAPYHIRELEPRPA